MKRKQMWTLCCILALALLLAGCGGGELATDDIPGDLPVQVEETAPPAEEPSGPEEVEEKNTNPDSVETPGQSEQPPSAEASSQPEEGQQQNGEPPQEESTVPVSPAPIPPETVPEQTTPSPAEENPPEETENTEMKLNVQIGDNTFTATLEDNAAVDALTELLASGPLVIQMNDYAGFEKVGSLGTSLPSSNRQTTTQAGDIVLYQGNQIVIFYGSNSWSYTRLGRIDDLTGWTEALGSGDVTVTFSLGA